MKTAEEVYRQITGCIINHGDIKTAMIEFAKLHVQAALEAADVQAENLLPEGCWDFVEDVNFIKNAYPESNIK
jgi:hypothetical protein